MQNLHICFNFKFFFSVEIIQLELEIQKKTGNQKIDLHTHL
jgi:hypothetical protein